MNRLRYPHKGDYDVVGNLEQVVEQLEDALFDLKTWKTAMCGENLRLQAENRKLREELDKIKLAQMLGAAT